MANPFKVGDIVKRTGPTVTYGSPVKQGHFYTVSNLDNECICVVEDPRPSPSGGPFTWRYNAEGFALVKAAREAEDEAFYEETPEIAEIRAAFNRGEVNA